MTLQHVGYIDLPPHKKNGGFDHAAVHTGHHLCYVAHTANDAVDVIDCLEDRYLRSIPNLAGVAGALVSEADDLMFTSNRGENTVSIFSGKDASDLGKISVGIRPNGLSYDPQSGLLLSAHVGDPNIPNSTTISMIDVRNGRVVSDIQVPGRTRWTIFDPIGSTFYVNIAAPPSIMVVDAANPTQIATRIEIPVVGPHGLDIDSEMGCLFCACDEGKLVAIDVQSRKLMKQEAISGSPDVIFYNSGLKHLYVAIGHPGVIDVFNTQTMERIETIITEPGAHTLAFDSSQNKVYAFLPETHRAAVYKDHI